MTVGGDVPDATANEIIAAMVEPGSRVLDLDSVPAGLIELLAQRECRVTAVQGNRAAAATVAAFADRVIPAALDCIDFDVELRDEVFDAITASGVLATATRPQELLSRIVPFVRPDGRVVVSVPNVAHGSVRLAFAAGLQPPTLGAHGKRWFDLESGRTLIASAGLEVTDVRRVTAAWQLDTAKGAVVPPGFAEWVAEQPESLTSQFVLRCVVATPALQRAPGRSSVGAASSEESQVMRLQARGLIEMNARLTAMTHELDALSVERSTLARRVQRQARRLSQAQAQIEMFRRSRAVKVATALGRIEAQLLGRFRRR